jgi:hypothetical protein
MPITLQRSFLGASVAALATLAGCSASPSRNILGSYFPSWMICALGGIAAAVIARTLFNRLGIQREIPAVVLVYLSIAAAVTFALWLLWLA